MERSETHHGCYTRRLETERRAAVAEVQRLIAGLGSNEQMMLLTFSNHAGTVCPFTNNKAHLNAALADVKPEETTTNLREALSIALSAARKAGLRLLREDGWIKVRAGVTTVDEVLTCTAV